MKVLIIGAQRNLEEFNLKFGTALNVTLANDPTELGSKLRNYDIIFDFFIDQFPENFEAYKELNKTIIFLNSVKLALAELVFLHGKPKAHFFGFNGVSTFLNREYLEVTLCANESESELKKVLKALGTEYLVVEDRVGMVTPRIIFMIINEAYFTVQEGTASREDIDQGMKLGTNYPYGPFEWKDIIGIYDVYETLEAIYEDTKDERYKICPLLKKEYLSMT